MWAVALPYQEKCIRSLITGQMSKTGSTNVSIPCEASQKTNEHHELSCTLTRHMPTLMSHMVCRELAQVFHKHLFFGQFTYPPRWHQALTMQPTKLTTQYFMLHCLTACKPHISYMEANAVVLSHFLLMKQIWPSTMQMLPIQHQLRVFLTAVSCTLSSSLEWNLQLKTSPQNCKLSSRNSERHLETSLWIYILHFV